MPDMSAALHTQVSAVIHSNDVWQSTTSTCAENSALLLREHDLNGHYFFGGEYSSG